MEMSFNYKMWCKKEQSVLMLLFSKNETYTGRESACSYECRNWLIPCKHQKWNAEKCSTYIEGLKRSMQVPSAGKTCQFWYVVAEANP